LNFGINCTFNVEDLVSYRDTFDTPSDSFMDEPKHDLLFESPLLPRLLPKLPHVEENIDSILDDQIISTRAEEHGTILLSGKDLNQRIHVFLRMISNDLIPTYWSIITTSNSFLIHTHKVDFFHLGK